VRSRKCAIIDARVDHHTSFWQYSGRYVFVSLTQQNRQQDSVNDNRWRGRHEVCVVGPRMQVDLARLGTHCATHLSHANSFVYVSVSDVIVTLLCC